MCDQGQAIQCQSGLPCVRVSSSCGPQMGLKGQLRAEVMQQPLACGRLSAGLALGMRQWAGLHLLSAPWVLCHILWFWVRCVCSAGSHTIKIKVDKNVCSFPPVALGSHSHLLDSPHFTVFLSQLRASDTKRTGSPSRLTLLSHWMRSNP